MNAQKDIRQAVWVCLLLAASLAIVYWPVHRFAFVNIDDNVYVTANAHVQNGLTWENIQWAFRSGECSNWHPLTWISHMLDVQLFRDNAGGHHVTSVLLHIANSALMFLLWWRLTGALWRSAFLAALFGLHPLRVESVAWIAERKDVLSMFFFLLTLLAYHAWVRAREQSPNPAWKSRSCYAMALLCFALGLMSKSMLVTLPFVLLLLDFWPLRRWSLESNHQPTRSSLPSLVLEKTPFFLLSAAASVTAYLVQKSGGAVAPLEKLPFLARLENTSIAYLHYLQAMLWPKDLAVLYPHPGFWPSILVLAATALLVLLSVAAWACRRRYPFLLTGWLWYLGTLIPVIGLVQIGVQAYADRYTYIPMIGIAAALAWGIPELVARSKHRLILQRLCGPAILLGCVVATSMQVRHWANDETLFSHAIRCTRDNSIAHNNLGFALARQGRIDDAIQQHLAALQINPDYTDARFNLGFAYSEQKRWDEAIEHYLAGLKRRPDAQAHNNLGSIYANQGKWEQAIAEYTKAVALEPNHPEAHHNWGMALGRMGKTDEELQKYEHALRIAPHYLPARSSLGTARLRRGDYDQARKEFLAVLERKPDDLGARNNLGSTFLRQERYAEAIETYRQALHYHPDSYQAHFNLGSALLRTSQYDEAKAEFETALRLNPNLNEAKEQLRLIPRQTRAGIR